MWKTGEIAAICEKQGGCDIVFGKVYGNSWVEKNSSSPASRKKSTRTRNAGTTGRTRDVDSFRVF